MPFIVTDACIRCKYTDCITVCPVDCFYEGENMLVISQSECIDCGICEPACPVDAIMPDSAIGKEIWPELNEKYSKIWPKITAKQSPHPDADEFKGVADKYPKFFSPLPPT